MARFVFSMQSVLDQRAHEEKLCQRELAERQSAFASLETQLQSIEQSSRQADDEMRQTGLRGSLDMGRIMGHRRFISGMRARVAQLATEMAQSRLLVEAARRKLAEAMRQRKTIELLRDKQFANWVQEQNQRELKLADDINTRLAYENLQAHDYVGVVR